MSSSSRKRKASSGKQPTASAEARRKTRADGPAEITIPLYANDRPSPERQPKKRRVDRMSSRIKPVPTPKKASPTPERSLSGISAPVDDVISDELNLSPSSPTHAPHSPATSPRQALQTPPRSTARSTANFSEGPRLIFDAVEIVSPRWISTNPRRNESSSPKGRAKSPSLQARGSPPPPSPSQRIIYQNVTTLERRQTRKAPSAQRESSAEDADYSSNTSLALSTSEESAEGHSLLNLHAQQMTRRGKEKAVELETSDDEGNYAPVPFDSTGPKDNTEDEEPLPSPPQGKSRTRSSMAMVPSSPTKIDGSLSPRHHHLLKAQKAAILRSLQAPPVVDPANSKDGASPASLAVTTLTTLLRGTTERGEGNSCLVWGHRGSGKSRVVNQALANISSANPIIVRLTAEAQHNDRLAMREMARQLMRQTGTSFAIPEDGAEDDGADVSGLNQSANMVPNAHLPAMISTLITLPRPTIVVLESFDLFAGHARQALLYCLLDTVQSCHAHTSGGASTSSNAGAGGIAVVGVTTRNDCLNLLEKRVKSRFSGRSIRVGPPSTIEEYKGVAKGILRTPLTVDDLRGRDDELPDDNEVLLEEWDTVWEAAIQTFMSNKEVSKVLRDLYTTTRDVRTLARVLIDPVLALSPNSPWLSTRILRESYANQLPRSKYHFLPTLSYACLSLLIAGYHVSNKGHDVFNFEILWSNFSRQVDRTASMPVMLDGASVGMIKVPKSIMFSAFDTLIELSVFQPVGPHSANVARQFIKYRCDVDRGEVMDAVDKAGNLKLKAWLKRAGD
ncbi:hypothetical protein FRB96_006978 [Tulasnella sp. 330]|nr:hypothetical protein FRB96_006978 [Tulasnella sp. 330]KAG8883814.1 hypothetical protein FRB97_005817 [Tulasnella sp. 331]